MRIINRDRANAPTHCPPLKYNRTLEEIAESDPRLPSGRVNDLKNAYGGQIELFMGDGDPRAESLTSAYRKGVGEALSARDSQGNCVWTEFGVSFSRWDMGALGWNDRIWIVFGTPPPPPPPPPPGRAIGKAPISPPPGVDMVNVFGGVNVTVTSSRKTVSKCVYNAKPEGPYPFPVPPPRPFETSGDGSPVTFKIDGIGIGTWWNVTVDCDQHEPAVLRHQF